MMRFSFAVLERLEEETERFRSVRARLPRFSINMESLIRLAIAKHRNGLIARPRRLAGISGQRNDWPLERPCWDR